jgi:hypothetical protein
MGVSGVWFIRDLWEEGACGTNGFSTSCNLTAIRSRAAPACVTVENHPTVSYKYLGTSRHVSFSSNGLFCAAVWLIPTRPPVRVLDPALRASCQAVQSLQVGALGPTPLRANTLAFSWSVHVHSILPSSHTHSSPSPCFCPEDRFCCIWWYTVRL